MRRRENTRRNVPLVLGADSHSASTNRWQNTFVGDGAMGSERFGELPPRKPAHEESEGPYIGEWCYVVVRDDGKLFEVTGERHTAVHHRDRRGMRSASGYEIVPCPAGAVPLLDVVQAVDYSDRPQLRP